MTIHGSSVVVNNLEEASNIFSKRNTKMPLSRDFISPPTLIDSIFNGDLDQLKATRDKILNENGVEESILLFQMAMLPIFLINKSEDEALRVSQFEVIMPELIKFKQMGKSVKFDGQECHTLFKSVNKQYKRDMLVQLMYWDVVSNKIDEIRDLRLGDQITSNMISVHEEYLIRLERARLEESLTVNRLNTHDNKELRQTRPKI